MALDSDRNHFLRAKRRGFCKLCKKPMAIGSWMGRWMGTWGHRECIQRWGAEEREGLKKYTVPTDQEMTNALRRAHRWTAANAKWAGKRARPL